MPRPDAILHIPSTAMGSCILAAVERDTRERVMDDGQRFNCYPATPMASVSWVLDGQLHMVDEHATGVKPSLGPALPRLVLSGPQRQPTVSWSPGPVHALTVGFYPDALRRLLGISIEPWMDLHVDLATVAPPLFLRACQSVLNAAGTDPFSAVQAQLLPLWNGPGGASPAPYLGDWVRSVVTRATHSTAGRHLRQLQRQVHEWTGQSHRDLQRFVRVEQAFLQRIGAHGDAVTDLAALAQDVGFADQSHMGRDVRRITGQSPGRFARRLESDEAFWYYRLMASSVKALSKA